VFGYSPRLILRFGAKEWTFPLKEAGFDGIDPTTLDRRLFFDWLRLAVEQEVNRPPRSAFYSGGKAVPHRRGVMVDRARLEEWLDVIHLYLNRPVPLPVVWSDPELTTEKLFRLKERKLGTYTTLFNPYNLNRSHNIYLSVRAIDHVVLMPGETFSFNRVVGRRSVERGYRPARIIVKGEYSEGIGGGICQTSSTLFNSVDQAGLLIVQRASHSKEVTYVPRERDATVSWGGPDFCFQNQLNEPVLILAEAKDGRLTVTVCGPDTIRHTRRHVPPPPGGIRETSLTGASSFGRAVFQGEPSKPD
jgi:vancomycin resistance protein YoaR